jgi:two-component system sensor histidine kinase KdpD
MAEIVLEKKPEPAKLRIYIGAAPGVGKTYHMLNDAYLMKHQQGVDVVIGLVESHGRKDTEARIRDLEIVPQRVIPYRGVTLKEMDVDAILARHPNTVVVDELAHTNVPGSKNRKRYEDVLELLEAGINVMTAVNIQHLETLNDAVNRSANTVIRETVPDNFLKRADEVVNIDMTVEELRSRLRQGKIYAPEKVEQSLANFFRKGNLNMLRELALRTTAEQVSSRAAEYRRTQGLEQAPIPEKVMVCLSTRPGTERLLRVGARVAGRLASNWYAVYVARPDDDKGHGDPEAYHRLEEYQRMARDLGAKVVSLTDRNVSDALIRFAQQENISHVVFGQSVRSRWDILLRGSVLNRFLSEVRDVTVQVVPMQKPLRRAFDGEEPGGTGHRGRLRAEHVMRPRIRPKRRVVAGVVGAEESSGKPVRADLVGHLAAQIVVGAHAGLGRQHRVVHARLERLVHRQRPQRRRVLLEGLHAQAAHDVVVPAGQVVAGPGERDVGQEVGLGAEVAAHAVGEGISLWRSACRRSSRRCSGCRTPARSSGANTRRRSRRCGVGLDVVAGDVLAARAQVESRLRIARAHTAHCPGWR